MAKNTYNTNLASEFYVLSVLYRLGLDANLTLGNKKAVDIVVVRSPGNAITIDVKAVAGATGWLVGNAAGPPREGHFVVLVTYDGHFRETTAMPRVWVFPHPEYLALVRKAKPPSTMQYITRAQVMQLKTRANAWSLLARSAAP